MRSTGKGPRRRARAIEVRTTTLVATRPGTYTVIREGVEIGVLHQQALDDGGSQWVYEDDDCDCPDGYWTTYKSLEEARLRLGVE